MNKRNSCATQRFGSILKKVNAEGLFEECANGSLEAYAHNGRTIDTFRIVIEFPHDSVLVTTRTGLGVEESSFERVKILLESINEIIPDGIFFIDEDNIVSFAARCGFAKLEELENPFDFIFYGGDTIGKYTEPILRVLLGSQIFIMKGKDE